MAFDLPPLLRRLLDDGTWVNRGGDTDERIPRSLADEWDPGAYGIHLENPTLTVADCVAQVPELTELWNLDDIDPARCLIIADFGLGSDNPIVLDYAVCPPAVRTQHLPTGSQTTPEWFTLADSFDEFVALLGL